jgi:hypothetical protein
VKGRSIRAVDERNSIDDSAQGLSTVGTLLEVPFQLGAPLRTGANSVSRFTPDEAGRETLS